jgi:hypothetical protein
MKYWLARAGEEKPEGPFSRADLSRMYHDGEVDMLDQVCLAGTERWQDVGKLLGLRDYQDPAAVPAALQPEAVVRAKKKGKAVGSSGCVLLIFGLLMLLLFWPVGVILIGAAIIVNYLSVKPTCTACGNVTVSTARQCAVCKAVFVPESQVKNLAMGLFMAVLFLGLIGLAVWASMEGSWNSGSFGSSESPGVRAQRDAQSWVRANLADNGAEVVSITTAVEVGGRFYRLAQVRGKNAFGGPIVAEFVSEGPSEDSVTWMTSGKDFINKAKTNEQTREVARRLGVRID